MIRSRFVVLAQAAAFLCALACGGLAPDDLDLSAMDSDVPATDEQPTDAEASGEPVLEDLLEHEDRDALAKAFGDALGTVTILENEVGDIDYPAIHVGTPQEVVFLMQPEGIANGIQIQRLDSTWVSKTGMRTGLTLEEVEALNGGPFVIGESPEGLQIKDFKGGKLDGVGVSAYFGKDGDMYPTLEVEAVDDGYPSDDAKLREAGLKLHVLSVY